MTALLPHAPNLLRPITERAFCAWVAQLRPAPSSIQDHFGFLALDVGPPVIRRTDR